MKVIYATDKVNMVDEADVLNALEEVVVKNARYHKACSDGRLSETAPMGIDRCTEAVINAFTRHNSFQKARFYEIYGILKAGGDYERL